MKKDSLHSNLVFWDTAKEYLYHHLPDIRKASPNTIASYRDGLNSYIDYLEQQKNLNRKAISFSDCSRENMNDYLDWMLNVRRLAEKTCNLRLTVIHSMLEYASSEHTELMAFYLNACSVKGVKVSSRPIEFFERRQMQALLSAPDTAKKTERRNQMMLIILYDTAARVTELLELTGGNLHMNSEIPYVTICGKGRKYRNIPLMDKTQQHLKRYLNEFHPAMGKDEPLFYAITYGERHRLSADTMETMLKKYVRKCIGAGLEMPDFPHCHMIRKTRAMDLYQSGVPLTHIQQLLGHEDLSTTSGFYAFATLDTLAKAMNKANGEASPDKKWNNKAVLKKLLRL
jgi:site-specific recombinase XerD